VCGIHCIHSQQQQQQLSMILAFASSFVSTISGAAVRQNDPHKNGLARKHCRYPVRLHNLLEKWDPTKFGKPIHAVHRRASSAATRNPGLRGLYCQVPRFSTCRRSKDALDKPRPLFTQSGPLNDRPLFHARRFDRLKRKRSW
jgi:hypothetical protein